MRVHVCVLGSGRLEPDPDSNFDRVSILQPKLNPKLEYSGYSLNNLGWVKLSSLILNWGLNFR